MTMYILSLLLLFLAIPASAQDYNSTKLQCDDPAMNAAQQAGCKIWFYATAGNSRFHTYVFQQRIGVMIDWFRVLNGESRQDRFKAWGLINDPGCCTPGSKNCPAKSYEETYGLDYCPGDDKLLQFVGKKGYKDPACDIKLNDEGSKNQRQSACDLDFGTSTGAMGLRKFPNPRFNADAWKKLNGGRMGTWQGFNAKLSQRSDTSDSRVSRLFDGSVEPPFLIGMACGACHIAFNPLNPPKDPTNPKMENLIGAIGNQYARLSEVMASGMPPNSPPWQVFAHSRPGAVDTSAVSTDQVNNAGTMNAILNFDKRPTFPGEQVEKWRSVTACASGVSDRSCWCEPGKGGKCWERSIKTEAVHHILKGGEDSIGIHEAVQRVYFNIGSCSEACWVNHLTDLKVVDPNQRNFGQTPFDIGQCRRDCPNFRAIEDRLSDVVSFLLVQRPPDLYKARGLASVQDLVEQLDKEYGAGSVDRGKAVFADNCARCHSSQTGPMASRDFLAKDANGVRIDWMGNDVATPVTEVGTNRSRALHSNHMTGHLYHEYGSNTLRTRKPDPNVAEPSDGGRGYYRNISLLSVWAFAPFMHDNSMGPEICGKPSNPANDFYRSPYVDASGHLLPNPPPCRAYDPSVKGRYDLYKASMDELLNPKKRIPKITMLDYDIPIDVGPKFWDPQQKKKVGVQIVIPKGIPAAMVGNFQHKPFVDDLVLSKTHYDQLKAKRGDAAAQEILAVANETLLSPTHVLTIADKHMPLLKKYYMSSTAEIENEGHRFGEDLSDKDKKALTAFLATL